MNASQAHGWMIGRFSAIAIVVAVTLTLLGVGPARANTPIFGDPVWFGSGSDFAQVVAVGDVDGDGDLDLVVGGRNGRVVVYVNDGTGNYARSSEFGASRNEVSALLLADLNGDGYLDVVTGSAGQNYVYLNQRPGRDPSASGAPALYGPATPFGAADERTLALAAGDVTGDGLYDLVAANDGQDYIYRGDGAGGYALESRISLGDSVARSTSAALVDLDRGNGLDVVVGSAGQTVLFHNQGNGAFQSRDLTTPSAAEWLQNWRCPARICREDTGPVQGAAEAVSERHVAAADLNGDSYPDLIEATSDSRLRIFLADARGSFLPAREIRPASELLTTTDVAVGDVDGDGRIDIVTAHPFAQNVVYLNAGKGEFRPGFGVGNEIDVTRGAALADVDGDSDVDLVFVNDSQQGVIYRNNGMGELAMLQQFGSGLERPSEVKLVDFNGDGYLDLVVAQDARPASANAVYLNSGAGRGAGDPVFLPAARLGPSSVRTAAALVGNFDQNPLPDVVLGNYAQPSQILFNVQDCQAGESCSAESRVLDEQKRLVLDAASGDLDGDGHLDIVLAIQGGRNVIFLSDGSGGFLRPREFGEPSLSTQSIALGDLDGDGDLDIVAGTSKGLTGQQDWVYRNDGKADFDARVALGAGASSTFAVALADFDGDGYLDVAAVRRGFDGRNAVYLNDGRGRFDWAGSERPFGGDLDDIRFITTNDFDGDGHPDIVTDAVVFLNDGQAAFGLRRSLDPSAAAGRRDHAFPEPVAVGDLNNDGAPDLVVSKRQRQHQVYLNTLRQAAGQGPYVAISGPAGRAAPDTAAGRPGVIPFTVQVSDPGVYAPGPVRVCYSLDGGGKWNLALQPGQTLDAGERIVEPPNGCPYREQTLEDWRASGPAFDGQGAATFEWDMAASGFFGQSQNVVLRAEVYPDHAPSPGEVAAISPHPYVAATTAPFAARGVQVQVLDVSDADAAPETAAGALVFKIPAGEQTGGVAMGSAGRAYQTDGQGYLQGRGSVAAGDTLVALLPITRTRTITTAYTLFHTSARPISTTIDAASAPTNTLLHQLVVSPANPLLLFDLNVSLEWDARNDPEFLQELDAAFKRSSEVLYDLSDGQMALGRVRVFQDKENWLTSDVQIYANNRVRPRASMGGIARQTLSDVSRDGEIIPNAYQPGAVRMGPVWDPFGQSRADLGRDWWRAFAHELGHHLLFLPDNYLGYEFDENGDIVGVVRVDCEGSVMTTAYDDDYSEFLDFSDLDPANWPGACSKTVAAHTTGFSDWETIQRKYPMVSKPGAAPNPGPAALPLALTQVQFVQPATAGRALPARFFDLRAAGQGGRLAVAQGQAYLFKTQGTPEISDDTVVLLGSTGSSDSIKVRGAAAGDRVCVFANDGGSAQIGCAEGVTELTSSIPVAAVAGWQPNVQVQPIMVPTLSISVTQVAGQAEPQIRVQPLGPTGAVTVSQVSPLGLASVRYEPPAGEGRGFTVVISGANTLSSTVPSVEAWLYSGASLAISTIQPSAAGQPALIQISRPGLAITVTQPISSGVRLRTQVMPGYQIGAQPYSPAAPASAVPDSADPKHRAQVILDYPAYSGFVRTWVEAPGDESGTWKRDVREAVSRFYLRASRNPDGAYAWGDSAIALLPAWQQKLSLVQQLAEYRAQGYSAGQIQALTGPDRLAVMDPLGLGTDDRALLGTDDRALLGTDDRALLGVDFWRQLWTDDRALLGTDDRALLGTDDRALLGTDDRGLLWTDDRALLGTDDRALLGADDRALLGTDDRGLLGTDDRALLGTDDRALLGADVRGLYANRRSPGAPISSADGGVTIFNRSSALTGDPGVESLEALPGAPNLPAWLTPVGQAHRFVASEAAPRAIEFGYYQREVPAGYEHTLTIYHSPDEGTTWTRLPTKLTMDDNQATAPADESGLYVLTAAVEIPFYTAGWNLFAYPVPQSLSIEEALASIDCCYTSVYGFDLSNPDDPWKVYDRRIASEQAWANDLTRLDFGQGYWINITEPVTLTLKVGPALPFTPTQVVALASPVSRRVPPAVYFGEIDAQPGAADAQVTALVGGVEGCGAAAVAYDETGTGRYLIKVDGADAGPLSVCGRPDRPVTLRLGEEVIAENLAWDNARQTAPAAQPVVVVAKPAGGIRVGGQVVVVYVGANLRRSAGYVDKPDGDVAASVKAGDRGEVMAGPVTADGLRWWQVRFGAVTGWIAELSSSGVRLLQASP